MIKGSESSVAPSLVWRFGRCRYGQLSRSPSDSLGRPGDNSLRRLSRGRRVRLVRKHLIHSASTWENQGWHSTSSAVGRARGSIFIIDLSSATNGVSGRLCHSDSTDIAGKACQIFMLAGGKGKNALLSCWRCNIHSRGISPHRFAIFCSNALFGDAQWKRGDP